LISQRVEANTTHALQETHRQIDRKDQRIIYLETSVARLNNRTTNADVIDRLQKTQDLLEAEMDKQTAAVTLQMQNAHADMQNQLKESEATLKKTEGQVAEKMKSTIGSVDAMITQANIDVNKAQMDVASKLKDMQDLLANTLLRINSDISVAEGKINKDVELLQVCVCVACSMLQIRCIHFLVTNTMSSACVPLRRLPTHTYSPAPPTRPTWMPT